jgi:ribosomal protein S18 acetylase RimI-like enzyme
MSATIKIRLMEPGEEAVVSDLVTSTFQHDVAPLYAQEGIREFLSYADPSALQDRQSRDHIILVASQDESIVGVLELRDYCHVSLLFVETLHQRQGVGRLLVNEALRFIKTHHPETQEVTVNSSPNAVEAYKRFGFQVRGKLQIKNGIRFVPMTLPLGITNST